MSSPFGEQCDFEIADWTVNLHCIHTAAFQLEAMAGGYALNVCKIISVVWLRLGKLSLKRL
jgi:hypothetical protein